MSSSYYVLLHTFTHHFEWHSVLKNSNPQLFDSACSHLSQNLSPSTQQANELWLVPADSTSKWVLCGSSLSTSDKVKSNTNFAYKNFLQAPLSCTLKHGQVVFSFIDGLFHMRV